MVHDIYIQSSADEFMSEASISSMKLGDNNGR